MNQKLLFVVSVLALIFTPSVPRLKGAELPDFQREIRPILSNACYKCHGPDEAERKGGKEGSGGLRFDTEEGARAALDDGVAIFAGHPEKSEMVTRIKSKDADEVMPPPKSARKLTATEIELIERWIRGGGKYTRHWSYNRPIRPTLPKVSDPSWTRNTIDTFILAELEKQHLHPQPEASRLILARRVSLDLTGLPSTPENADIFLKDRAPDAYERMVDRLLSSPAFGEHWARQWMDLARYADSAGYADDPSRTIWGFRDYTIRAINANLPFDQFTIEQIAGDLLPNPKDDQLIATAFHRNTMTNNEGGTNDEEFRNAAVVDRTNTTMAVWMGTSFACAQCHTHKYDPITNQEYFKLFAFLNNTQDADRRDESPIFSFLSEEQKAQRALLETELTKTEARLQSPPALVLGKMAQWAQSFPLKVDWIVPPPEIAEANSNIAMKINPDRSISVENNPSKTDTYRVELPVSIDGQITALRLESIPTDALPSKGAGYGDGNFVVTKISAKIVSSLTNTPPIEINFSEVYTDFSQAGWDARLVPSTTSSGPAKKGSPQRGWAVGGSVNKSHQITILTSSPTRLVAGSKVVVTIEQNSSMNQHTLGSFRLSVTTNPRVAEFLRATPELLAAFANPIAQRPYLLDFYTHEVDPEMKADSLKVVGLRKQIAGLPKITVPIQRELPVGQQRKTRVQLRGNYLALAEEVQAGVPEAFPPLPQGMPPNRLALAQWLVDPANPLTARVTANRFWEAIFGTGIVRTSEEFGAQGDLPSHPELLDWLATELVANRWNVKQFLRLLVTSATYRQSSKVTPPLLAADPDNRLLARGPRFRLSAEMVRDQALAVSGLLSSKMYGPPVRPPRPSMGLSAAFGGGLDWQSSTGEDAHRRALYTEWRRTSPYASMTTFDAPSREVCTLRRNQSNTPLQALVTLNDPVYLEAAQALARRIISTPATTSDRVTQGFRLCLTRHPTAHEVQRIASLYEQALAAFKLAPDKAKNFATIPIGTAPSGTDLPELAAWTSVASMLLNLDETLMKP